MEIHIITAFPDMFKSPFEESIVKRAKDKGIVKILIHDLRDWTTDNHKTIDAKPYGGGAGMVMLFEPIYKAVSDIKKYLPHKSVKVILTSAKGEEFSQQHAQNFAKSDALIIICGHYEGVDERVNIHLVDHEISIGKFVLTGGELPAMMITDSTIRLLPGVLGNEESLSFESYTDGKTTESPHYTRPAVIKIDGDTELKVPDVLIGGNHKEIENWRKENTKSN